MSLTPLENNLVAVLVVVKGAKGNYYEEYP
jgi:hypothetical protein